MYERKRGRPKVADPKSPAVVIRLNSEDKAILEKIAANSGDSVYTYVNNLIRERIDKYKKGIQ